MSDSSPCLARGWCGRLCVLVAGLSAASLVARAASIPDIALERIVDGLNKPVHAVPRGDDLIVVEQRGILRMVEGNGKGAMLMDLRDRVEAGGEKGLLAVALHPRFAENGRLFVNYTTRVKDQLTTRISEFAADPVTCRADKDSERVVLSFEQPFANHNGGQIVFGPDGLLYIGVGDGGSANDPQDNGQSLATWLGKILRIRVDGAPGAYEIPEDNPFRGRAGARPEIYAYGLRNPWRFSFDRATGRIFCGDVGQNHREEVGVIEAGGNYGWRIMEGMICTPRVNPDCQTNGLTLPMLDYPRSDGASVTGGFVYRGEKIPSLQGVYVYGDFVSGHIWGLREQGGKAVAHRRLLEKAGSISSFAEDAAGEILVIDYNGSISRIVADGG